VSHPTITHLTTPRIARLLNCSRSKAIALAKSGQLGEIPKLPGWPKISIAAVETYAGKTFTPEQIVAAANAGAWLTSAAQRAERDALEAERREQEFLRTEPLVKEVVRARDAQWLAWLNDRAARQAFPHGPVNPFTGKSPGALP